MARARPKKRRGKAGQTPNNSGATIGYEAEARKLDVAIEANLETLGFGNKQ